MAENKRDVLEMLSEFLRESAVLVLVFVPLEFYKSGKITVEWLIVIILFSILVLAGGIVLERIR